jgi:hypothetical protein
MVPVSKLKVFPQNSFRDPHLDPDLCAVPVTSTLIIFPQNCWFSPESSFGKKNKHLNSPNTDTGISYES